MLIGALDSLLNHLRRRKAIAHALALTRMLGVWIPPTDDDDDGNHYQVQFAFEMSNNSAGEALRYEVSHAKLLLNNQVLVEHSPPPNNTGVVAPGLVERFTLDPLWIAID